MQKRLFSTIQILYFEGYDNWALCWLDKYYLGSGRCSQVSDTNKIKFIAKTFFHLTFNRSLMCHLHISHNAPYLPPPKFYISIVLFSLGTAVIPRRNEKQRFCNFLGGGVGGANKVHYGRCARRHIGNLRKDDDETRVNVGKTNEFVFFQT